MKKYLLIFIFGLFFILFNSNSIKAESVGLCKITQADSTYDVEVPFYWYKVIKEAKTNDSLAQNISYSHQEIYVNNKETCTSINNSKPSFVIDKSSVLNNTTTTFYYSETKINDSETIFDKSSSVFETPTYVTSKDLTIISTYLSLDNMPPIIADENINSVIIIPVEQTLDINYLKTKITAYDEVDGTVNIEVYSDTYSSNKKNLGEYQITFIAKDSSNNCAYLTIKIKVIDNIKPVISGKNSLKSLMSNPLTIDDIKSNLTINDNYYTLTTQDLKIIDNFYSYNTKNEGYFDISFNITDPSNNTSETFTIKIEMYDDISPTIEGETNYETSNKILLNLEEIKNKLIVKDNIDSNPKIELKTDSYTDNYYKIGTYQIVYIATDRNNNQSSLFTINISVTDKTKPIFYISKKFIGVDGSSNITIDQLIDIIEETNNINTTGLLSYSIIKDEYTPNKTIPGTYIVELKYEYENQETINIQTNIVVEAYVEQKEKSTPTKSFWSTLKDFLLKIWNFIKFLLSFKWLILI